MSILARIALVIIIMFMFKAGKALSKFDISENIGHSHKQVRKPKD